MAILSTDKYFESCLPDFLLAPRKQLLKFLAASTGVLWLDKSLDEVASDKYSTDSIHYPVNPMKPWWKTLLNRKK